MGFSHIHQCCTDQENIKTYNYKRVQTLMYIKKEKYQTIINFCQN